MKPRAKSSMGLAKTDQTLVTEEEMQRLYLDRKPIRHYCLQCRGPKLMIPTRENTAYQSSPGFAGDVPARYGIFCGTCGTKYWAKVEGRPGG